MRKKSGFIIIHGKTEDGHTFRPSDWAERLCGHIGCIQSDGLVDYSPNMYPACIDGGHCIMVQPELEHEDPVTFKSIMNFAKSNRLVVEHDY